MTGSERRRAFRFVEVDGFQYHFFASDRAFSLRGFYRSDLCVHAAWVYDGELREVCRSSRVWRQSDSRYLDISSEIVELRDKDGEIVIRVRADDERDGFTARVRPQHSFRWKDSFSDANDEVLHQPDLRGRIDFRGATYPAVGYCKHVEWRQAPRHGGYRFLHGVLDAGRVALWSADAVFGYRKYDYFKMLEADGSLVVADAERSSHKQNTIYAKIGARELRVDFEELGTWELPLISPTIDTLVQQRYGRIVCTEAGSRREGVAVTEYGFGKFSDSPVSQAVVPIAD